MAGQLTLAMRRELPAVPAVVFDAFVDPGRFAAWFGPEGFAVSTVEFSPHVGDRYRILMQPPNGERFGVTGEVTEIDPPSRLSFTFVYEEPNPDDVETQVAVLLLDRGGSTELDLTQGPFTTEQRRALTPRRVARLARQAGAACVGARPV
jgi:uncharacterized protein YndB with AHSA1/START domain